jgi:hypothetical protein
LVLRSRRGETRRTASRARNRWTPSPLRSAGTRPRRPSTAEPDACLADLAFELRMLLVPRCRDFDGFSVSCLTGTSSRAGALGPAPFRLAGAARHMPPKTAPRSERSGMWITFGRKKPSRTVRSSADSRLPKRTWTPRRGNLPRKLCECPSRRLRGGGDLRESRDCASSRANRHVDMPELATFGAARSGRHGCGLLGRSPKRKTSRGQDHAPRTGAL